MDKLTDWYELLAELSEIQNLVFVRKFDKMNCLFGRLATAQPWSAGKYYQEQSPKGDR